MIKRLKKANLDGMVQLVSAMHREAILWVELILHIACSGRGRRLRRRRRRGGHSSNRLVLWRGTRLRLRLRTAVCGEGEMQQHVWNMKRRNGERKGTYLCFFSPREDPLAALLLLLVPLDAPASGGGAPFLAGSVVIVVTIGALEPQPIVDEVFRRPVADFN
jgi:hypothetical protein